MKTFIGHFQLLKPDKPIKDTGLFEVYKAVDTKTAQIHLLKVLKEEYSEDQEIVSLLGEYYLKWCRATLKTVNLVEASEISGQVGSTIYIVQELFEAEPIHSYLQNNPDMNILDFKPIFKQICDGLLSLHHEGIWHYELNPSNILIHQLKRAKIVGEGSLAVALGNKDFIHKLIKKDEKEFITPEILEGKNKDAITQACDIYSLGNIIESLPFKHNKEVLASALEEDPGKRLKSVKYLYDLFDDIFFIDKAEEETKPITVPTFKKEIILEQVRAKPNQPVPFKYILPDSLTKRPGVKIKWTSLPPFSYFNENTYEFSWKPGIEHNGKHIIEFQVIKGSEVQMVKLPILVRTGMVIKCRQPESESSSSITNSQPTATPPLPDTGTFATPYKTPVMKKSSLPEKEKRTGVVNKISKSYESVKSYFRKDKPVVEEVADELDEYKSEKEKDRVHFSVTGPPCAKPGSSFIIDVWAHLKEQREEVIKQALQASREKDIIIKSRGPVSVARGTVLTAQLAIEELKVEEPTGTILWEGDIGNIDFAVLVPKNVEEGVRRGRADISVNGLRIARLNFTITIGEATAKTETLLLDKEMHRKAFASYAREDTNQVLPRIQGIQKGAPGLDIFMDVHSLRSGQNWEAELRNIIPKVDVFYLFWSENARKSKWVEMEWKCALETRGIEFIDPVPMVSPEKVPPPQELASKHFSDWILAYMRY